MAGGGEVALPPPVAPSVAPPGASSAVTSAVTSPAVRRSAPSARAEARFIALYERHYPRVLGYAQRRVGDRARAEDIAADTFRIAWEHTRKDGPPSPGWLFVTARNVMSNERRAALRLTELGRKLAVEARIESGPGSSPGPGSDPGTPRERFYAALDALTADQRELLMAHYWDGLSTAECGALLGCSGGAVRVRLHRARAALRRQLESQKSQEDES